MFLITLGVLEKANNPEWGSSSFTQHKPKTNRVCFLSALINLNKQLKCKPYQIPNNNEMFLKLEGFQYSKSLDLNMGYDHIRLIKNASKLCTIILPWENIVKNIYQWEFPTH